MRTRSLATACRAGPSSACSSWPRRTSSPKGGPTPRSHVPVGRHGLFVISDSQERERDELVPGERQARLSDKELYARVQRYIQTRDDEDLAIEQLRSSLAAIVRAPRDELDKAADAVAYEDAAAERPDPPAPVRASNEALRAADDSDGLLIARPCRDLSGLRRSGAGRADQPFA